MKTITFNEKQLSIVFDDIQRSLFCNVGGDNLYLISSFHQSFDDESQIASFTYGLDNEATEDREVYLADLFEGMAENLKISLPENLLQEIVNIDNDHLMIVNNENDSLQIHFNDATITCILHLTGQY